MSPPASKSLNRSVLVLNQSYEPLHVCSVRRAIVLVFRGRAEVVEALDSYIHTVSQFFPIPSVVRWAEKTLGKIWFVPVTVATIKKEIGPLMRRV